MLKKLIYFTLAAYIAWYSGPALTKVFWFLPITDIAEAITPTSILSHGFSFYTSFLVWTLLVWVMLQASGLMFVPAGIQQYGETKPARFIKGVLAELLVLALFSIPVFWLLFMCGGRSIVIGHLDAVWTTATIWRQGFWIVRDLWQVALPISLVLHFCFHKRLKRQIGRMVEPLLRFRDQSRGGHGGSSRFAGIFDEWSLG